MALSSRGCSWCTRAGVRRFRLAHARSAARLEHRGRVQRTESRRRGRRRTAGRRWVVSQEIRRSRCRFRQADLRRIRRRLSQQRGVDQRAVPREATLRVQLVPLRPYATPPLSRSQRHCGARGQFATAELALVLGVGDLSPCPARHHRSGARRSVGHVRHDSNGQRGFCSSDDSDDHPQRAPGGASHRVADGHADPHGFSAPASLGPGARGGSSGARRLSCCRGA